MSQNRNSRRCSKQRNGGRHVRALAAGAMLLAAGLMPRASFADEGGVSFWIPGFFGSLAAVPQQAPGWSLQTVFYNTNVKAGGDVALAREFEIGKVPLTFSGTANASIKSDVPLGIAIPLYALPTPVLGGQLTLGMGGIYGRNDTTLAGSVTGTIFPPSPLPPIPVDRFDSINSTLWGFGDLIPLALLRWNQGVNNWMIYGAGDIPVGAYQSTRLANLGIGHGVADAGVGYTYLNQQTGHEFTAVLGFTANLENYSTNYTNGVDMHLDWGASQFLSKQTMVGLVGYVYQEVGCDSGSGDRVGCFRSRVIGIGPQAGYIFPMGNGLQGYLNLKAYGEFDNAHRPDGWNVWLTFAISPAAAPPPASTRMMTK